MFCYRWQNDETRPLISPMKKSQHGVEYQCLLDQFIESRMQIFKQKTTRLLRSLSTGIQSDIFKSM